ncbi:MULTISPECIES: sensor histidine kinase [Glycomyces]|uniref:histidine kinase n=2 Tax=Glycomyces TaxID=58113 RepID=A0A9X3T7E2_9ACTN|nr:HAMP domain-containing sensor histidine kinase [Glycomyces lechevalierae]MDA1384133.1 HAMP domain-containing sensor histidine kinase [Glycomyces lechevalierae]MDR7339438.1 signal transduction histidine kinase [Glycomyces lechevalierae]
MRRVRLTLRARLTLVYGGLFLAGGVFLLLLTYSLVEQAIPDPEQIVQGTQRTDATAGPVPSDDTFVKAQDFRILVTGQVWNDALDTIRNEGTQALLLVSVATIALGWLVAGRMLRPLQRVTDTAAQIAESPAADKGLHQRIKVSGPRDELRDLAEAFNRMLERLDQSFDGQRAFISNASHELRTPLTVTRALLEVAAHRPGASSDVRLLSETLLEVNTRHERLIEGLLLLMRSDRELAERSYVDLSDIAEHVAAQTPSGAVAVTAACEEAPTRGEPVLLERLAQNLVENAVRYNTDEDGWVRVTTRRDGDASILEVANSGPVVPAFEVEGLFEPFRRLGTERLATASKGAGLGLSIVRAIAKAHGGEATAAPRPEGGLTVTVALPASAD